MNNSEIRGVIFIIKYKERFLLEQRDDNSKLSKWSWVFPGGKKDEGEEALQTVIREAKEEFGLMINSEDCRKLATAPTHSERGLNEIWFCEINEIKRPFVVSESAGMGWFTFDEIKNMDLGYRQSELVVPILVD